MSDAWGGSWGGAWGVSWGSGSAPTPPPVEPARGTAAWLGGARPYDRGRTKEERAEDRKRFGIPAPIVEVIEAIAEGQVERLEADEQKRFEELSRELQLRGIEWEAQYLEMLNAKRQALIDAEIGKLLRQQIEDEQIMLMLLAAL